LTVKLQLLPGRNTVQVRGSPPFSDWGNGIMDRWIFEAADGRLLFPSIHHSNNPLPRFFSLP